MPKMLTNSCPLKLSKELFSLKGKEHFNYLKLHLPSSLIKSLMVVYIYIYINIFIRSSLGRIRSLSLYEKKNNYESMEINLQTNKLTHLIRGKSCCCKVTKYRI